MRSVSVVALLALVTSAPAAGQALRLIPGVAEIASTRIKDVAIAEVDRPDPVIYYNPDLANRYGPLLTRFFLAHEYGHIARQHSRLKLQPLQAYVRDSVLRAQELEADCYAASQEGTGGRDAAEAALRFFSRLGPFRFDAEHPTGAQRAARILECLPGPRTAVTYGRGDTGVDRGPVSGEPEPVRFEVRTPDLSTLAFGTESTVWVDGLRVGEVSNMRAPWRLAVDRFAVGIHSYQISMRVFSLDHAQQFSVYGSVIGRGQVLVQAGDRFTVQWAPGEKPTLEREAP